jgi:segregation and condensation protein B
MTEDLAVKDDTTQDTEPAADRPDGRPALAPGQLAGAIEAILLTLDKPVAAARLAEALGLAPPQEPSSPATDAHADPAATQRPRKRTRRAKSAGDGENGGGVEAVEAAIQELNSAYAATGRSFRIESVAGGHRIMTLPAFAPAVAAFHRSRASARLSRAAVETLAIIAYKQPITRAHLEAIRGVNCGEVLRSLMERRLVCIKGRAEELGRPILYGTGKEFLDAFGLSNLKDLPSATELQVNP